MFSEMQMMRSARSTAARFAAIHRFVRRAILVKEYIVGHVVNRHYTSTCLANWVDGVVGLCMMSGLAPRHEIGAASRFTICRTGVALTKKKTTVLNLLGTCLLRTRPRLKSAAK